MKTQTHGDDNIFTPVSEFSMSFNPDIFQPHVVHVDPEVRETYTDLDGVGGFYHGEYEISVSVVDYLLQLERHTQVWVGSTMGSVKYLVTVSAVYYLPQLLHKAWSDSCWFELISFSDTLGRRGGGGGGGGQRHCIVMHILIFVVSSAWAACNILWPLPSTAF